MLDQSSTWPQWDAAGQIDLSHEDERPRKRRNDAGPWGWILLAAIVGYAIVALVAFAWSVAHAAGLLSL